MGLGGISPWSLLLILGIVLLLFGTKKLKGLGGDLGGAIKGFKSAMSDDNSKEEDLKEDPKKVVQEGAPMKEDTPVSEKTADIVKESATAEEKIKS